VQQEKAEEYCKRASEVHHVVSLGTLCK
jgi:hypothetical protein